MLSNFSSINTVNQKYLNQDIDIYKNTVKTMLKIKKDIIQLKNNKDNHYNSQGDIISFQDEQSLENSLVLLDIMKKELEKNILKKYKIEHGEIQKNIDDTNDYQSIINNNIEDNKTTVIKKNFKSI